MVHSISGEYDLFFYININESYDLFCYEDHLYYKNRNYYFLVNEYLEKGNVSFIIKAFDIIPINYFSLYYNMSKPSEQKMIKNGIKLEPVVNFQRSLSEYNLFVYNLSFSVILANPGYIWLCYSGKIDFSIFCIHNKTSLITEDEEEGGNNQQEEEEKEEEGGGNNQQEEDEKEEEGGGNNQQEEDEKEEEGGGNNQQEEEGKISSKLCLLLIFTTNFGLGLIFLIILIFIKCKLKKKHNLQIGKNDEIVIRRIRSDTYSFK